MKNFAVCENIYNLQSKLRLITKNCTPIDKTLLLN